MKQHTNTRRSSLLRMSYVEDDVMMMMMMIMGVTALAGTTINGGVADINIILIE